MLPEALLSSAEWWHEAKLLCEHATAISHDSLHVIAGVIIQLAAALLTRRSVANWTPWAVVLSFALVNECVDVWVEQWPSLGMQMGEGAKDILLTLFLPTILLLAVRYLPGAFSGGFRARGNQDRNATATPRSG